MLAGATVGVQPRLPLADFPERILLYDLAAAKRVEIATPHLDALAVSPGAAQRPLRHADVARDKMRVVAVVHIWNAGEA